MKKPRNLSTTVSIVVAALLVAGCSNSSEPAAVSTVTIVADATTITVGSNMQLSAQARDAYGNLIIGKTATWSSNSASLTVVPNTGFITAVSAGPATISATIDGKQGSLPFTVVGLPTLTIASATPAASATRVGIESPITIQFSDPLNAASVNPQTVRLTAGGDPVAGALVVNGNTITFTPTAPLSEFETQHTLMVTTGVLSTVGDFLAADHTRTFTTVFWDPAWYYRVTNELLGPTLALDTFDGTFACGMLAVGNNSGQRWYFTPTAEGSQFYIMRNQFQGDALGLEGANEPDRCFLTGPASPGVFFTGQRWRPVAFGNGYYLRNLALGDARSLAVNAVGDAPMMVSTANLSRQKWFFTRMFKR